MAIKGVYYLAALPILLVMGYSNAGTPPQEPLQILMTKFDNKTCNQTNVLARQIDTCAKPLMDLIQGTLAQWPHTENEMDDLCKKFGLAESCIRDRGRRCAKGLNKVIVSTVANSIQRTRKRECTWKKYKDYLKLSSCIEQNLHISHTLMANTTSRMIVVEEMKNLAHRTTGVCCAVNELEQEMYRLFTPVCKDQVPTLLRLYRSIMEDVLQIICPSPKCDNPYRGAKLPEVHSVSANGLVAYIMRIIFSLGG